MPELEHVVRILVAVVLGGLIGFERELQDKPAGFRTIILICVGACVFTILSEVLGGPELQGTRIAAQVVTGIGFLGAGAILRDRQAVFGLTTAATIWAVAAIGMAAGFGRLGLAAFGTVVILIALWIFDWIEHWIGESRDLQQYRLAASKTDDALERIDALFEEGGLKVRKRTWYEEGDDLVVLVVAMGPKRSHESMRLAIMRSGEYSLRRG
jgi:putative Mg2+ transporter-C (MgtC) family protein